MAGTPEQIKAQQKRYRERYKKELKAKRSTPEHYEKTRTWAKARYNRMPPDAKYGRHLKQNYGITIEDYDQMYAEQDGKCAICSEPRSSRGKTCLHVDHDHDTGKVRALLCIQCNVGIGMLKTDPQILELARNYLIEHSVLE